ATSKAEQASPRQDKAKRLLAAFYGKNTTTAGQYQAAEELVALKKAAKVSWATLGLSETDASLVIDLLSTGPAAPKKPTTQPLQPPAEAPKLEGDRIQIARQ